MKRSQFTIAHYFCLFLVSFIVYSNNANAEFQTAEFDEFYYSYSSQPQPSRLNEALDYFVHVTGTAGIFENEKKYKLFIQSRARFFAELSNTNPSLARHAESLFPQVYWAQKSILLEIFRRSKEPGIKSALERWSRNEEDDDRRLMLEQAAIINDSENGWLFKPILSPNTLEEQWAVFFASGNTAAITNSIKCLNHSDVRSDTSTAYSEFLHDEKKSPLQTLVYSKLNCYAFYFPEVRSAIFTLLQANDTKQIGEKHELYEMLAWRYLDSEDREGLRQLMPILVILWDRQPEKLIYARGAISVMEMKEQDVQQAVKQLSSIAPIWAARLEAFYIYFINKKRLSTGDWKELQISGDQFVTRFLENLKAIKSFRTYEQLEFSPKLSSHNELIRFRQQIKNISKENGSFGWQRDGEQQTAWKQKENQFYFWAESQKKWVEIRNQQIRDRILEVSTLDSWIELFSHAKPLGYYQFTGDTQAFKIRIKYELDIKSFLMIWADSFSPCILPNMILKQIPILVDIDGRTGELICFQINSVYNEGTSEKIKIEKNYFNIQK